MRWLALSLALLILAAVATAIFFEVRLLPGQVQATVPNLEATYLPGETVSLPVQIRPLTRYPFSVEVSGKLLPPRGQFRELSRSQLRLSPKAEPAKLQFTIPLGLDVSTGVYRLRVEIVELAVSRTYPLLSAERAFMVKPLPPPPEPPKPAPKRKPRPRRRPKKKGTPKPIAKFLGPSGEKSYGETLEVQLEVVNMGSAAADFSVELRSDPPQLFEQKTLGPFHLLPAKRTVLKDRFMLHANLPEGEYTLTAQMIPKSGLSFVPITAQTRFYLKDQPPRIVFLNPPLTSRVGFSNIFRVRAEDDLGVETVLFFLIDPGFSDLQMLPMSLESGDPLSGTWKIEEETFSQPGTYTFYAQVEDTGRHKIQTKKLRFVVRTN